MKRVIVDSNDRIIGAKEKTDIDFATDIYRVSAVWLMNTNGDVLIAQRALHDTNGAGLWGPSAAGTVEEGETYEENVYKELQEELGVSGLSLTEGPTVFVESYRRYFCAVYFGVIDMSIDEFNPNPDEVAALRWIPLEELRRDIIEHPEKYVPSIATSVGLLR